MKNRQKEELQTKRLGKEKAHVVLNTNLSNTENG
jgi:hypothetical protein